MMDKMEVDKKRIKMINRFSARRNTFWIDVYKNDTWQTMFDRICEKVGMHKEPNQIRYNHASVYISGGLRIFRCGSPYCRTPFDTMTDCMEVDGRLCPPKCCECFKIKTDKCKLCGISSSRIKDMHCFMICDFNTGEELYCPECADILKYEIKDPKYNDKNKSDYVELAGSRCRKCGRFEKHDAKTCTPI